MSPYMATLRHYSAPSPAMDHFQSIPRERRAEPFLKWAGGKKRLLSAYDPLFPAHFDTYHEPFLGGGAVYMYLAHTKHIERGILSDVNAELIHLYRVVRDDVERLIAEASAYPYEKDFYYAIRARDPREMTSVERAARMLYLNRTCFNGLYRVNKKGQFNVPIGRYDKPQICNASNLRNVSNLLQGCEIQHWSFETILEIARPGDFVYMDPPYQPLTKTSNFTSYTADAFDESHQGRLFEIFRILDRRGCLVMLSNSATPLVRDLYKMYDLKEIQAPRSVTSRTSRRSKVSELVIRNFG